MLIITVPCKVGTLFASREVKICLLEGESASKLTEWQFLRNFSTEFLKQHSPLAYKHARSWGSRAIVLLEWWSRKY